jgi:ABC-2 type transport system ATP-binding protein
VTASTPAPREPLDDSGDADREASLPGSAEAAEIQSRGALSGVEEPGQKATTPKPRAPRPRAPRKTAAQRAAEPSTSTPESAVAPPAPRPTAKTTSTKTTSTKKPPAKRPAARRAAGDTKPGAQRTAPSVSEPKADHSAQSAGQGVEDPEISTVAAPGPPPPLPVAPPVFVVPPPPPLPPRPPVPDLTYPVPEAGSEPAEQDIQAAEPDTDTAEPDTDAAEPVTDAAEPDTDAAEPDTDAAEPDTDAAAPVPEEAAAGFGRVDVSAPGAPETSALLLRGVGKVFGGLPAVDGLDLEIPAGSFYGLVGPNGAGKTTTLSMMAGLLRPDAGTVSVCGVDAAREPVRAKKMMGVLPDRLRTFDRLTGRQLLYYYGVLRGLAPAVVHRRIADLARAFDLTDSLGRTVSDYSAGMTKKVMLAGALIHSPRVLVLDEPFEAVDPVSSEVILDILRAYVEGGGTVVLSSHGMALVERVCDRVAVIVGGRMLAEGTVAEVRGELTLEQRFVELSGGIDDAEGLEWLHTFSG